MKSNLKNKMLVQWHSAYNFKLFFQENRTKKKSLSMAVRSSLLKVIYPMLRIKLTDSQIKGKVEIIPIIINRLFN